MPLSKITPNIIKETDSYKVTHWKIYEDGIEKVYSFLETRVDGDETVMAGLRYILEEHFEGQVVTMQKINEAEKFFQLHFGGDYFNRADWEYILEKYGGRLPLRIKAVPEGTVVTTHNVLLTVENTDPRCFWLTNYVETLLMQIWYPISVATYSRKIKKLLIQAFKDTTDLTPEEIKKAVLFKLHDFGYRGSSCKEAAAIGGFAHLINFLGTDTLAACELAAAYYDCPMAGFSIPATEHSIMTTSGRMGEKRILSKYFKKFPNGTIAFVGDSFNVFNMAEVIIGDELKPLVMGRNGTVVFRPDSGDPVDIDRKILWALWNKYGGSINSKGFKVLDPHIRVIQGDGINLQMVAKILDMLREEKFSVENITFGSGGALLQKHDRDEYKMAMKCSAVMKNGEWFDVIKDPITDQGKKSKAGRFVLVKTANGYMTETVNDFNWLYNQLETVFEDGDILEKPTLDEIRARAEEGLI